MLLLGGKMGYHEREIKKGILGDSSKIIEEVDEYMEALEQNNPILAMWELSDIYGALEALACKHGLTMDDLKRNSDKTKSVFEEGGR